MMMTAHQRGVCVIAVYTRDAAETKANPPQRRYLALEKLTYRNERRAGLGETSHFLFENNIQRNFR
jgi:ATP-dependent Clp protease adaptor protein ClpS